MIQHKKPDNVQSIDRLFNIIELLALSRDGLGITDIANNVQLPKSTVHRLIKTLVLRGYIEKTDDSERYKIGPRFIEIASLYLHRLELRTEANPILRLLSMRTNSTVHLAVLKGRDAMYIEKIEPVTYICMYSQIGRSIPAYSSALGKVLLSGLDDEELLPLVNEMSYIKFTNTTISNPTALLAEIDKVRINGYAIDNGEHENGIFCVAAPVRNLSGRVFAAVSVSKYTSDDAADFVKVKDMVIEAANDISKRMGFFTNSITKDCRTKQ